MEGRFTNGLWTKRIRTSPVARVPERATGFLIMPAVLALLCGVAVAGDPKQPDPEADAELLEFLGSVDSGADSPATANDGSWIDYLSQTDISKVAKAAEQPEAARKQAADPPAPAATPPAPAPGDKKNE